MASEDRQRVRQETLTQNLIDRAEAGERGKFEALIQDYSAQARAVGTAVSFDFLSFDDLDDTPLQYRIAGIWPEGGHMLLSAYAKCGKTTLTMHLLKALADGTDFLGRECNQVDGTAVYVNLELSQQMLRSYATEAGLDLAHKKLRVLDWRGRAGHFRVGDAAWREALAAELKEIHCDVLVIDPLSPILAVAGIKSNDTDETRNFLESLGELAALAGCDLFVVDHTGHADKSRARNSSAKLDWPDALWALQSDGGDDSPRRKIDVKGRGVSASLDYYLDDSGDLVTGEVSDKPAVVAFLKADIGQTVMELTTKSGCMTRQATEKQLKKAEARKLARREPRENSPGFLWYLESSGFNDEI
jgi:hypothetical protein